MNKKERITMWVFIAVLAFFTLRANMIAQINAEIFQAERKLSKIWVADYVKHTMEIRDAIMEGKSVAEIDKMIKDRKKSLDEIECPGAYCPDRL
jgi:hypothetical protein